MGGKTSSPRSSTPIHKLSQEEHKKLTVNRQRTHHQHSTTNRKVIAEK